MPTGENTPNYITNKSGYEIVTDTLSMKSVAVHQLVSIANGSDPEKIFSGGDWQVHHENHLSWDNRPGNLVLLTDAEHNRRHHDGVSVTEEWLEEKVVEEELSATEISNEYGANLKHIQKMLKEYNLRWDLRWKR